MSLPQIVFILRPFGMHDQMDSTVSLVAWEIFDLTKATLCEIDCLSDAAVCTARKSSRESCIQAGPGRIVPCGYQTAWKNTFWDVISRCAEDQPISFVVRNESGTKQQFAICTVKMKHEEDTLDYSPFLVLNDVGKESSRTIKFPLRLEAFCAKDFLVGRQLSEQDLRHPVLDDWGRPWSMLLDEVPFGASWYIHRSQTGTIRIKSIKDGQGSCSSCDDIKGELWDIRNQLQMLKRSVEDIEHQVNLQSTAHSEVQQCMNEVDTLQAKNMEPNDSDDLQVMKAKMMNVENTLKELGASLQATRDLQANFLSLNGNPKETYKHFKRLDRLANAASSASSAHQESSETEVPLPASSSPDSDATSKRVASSPPPLPIPFPVHMTSESSHLTPAAPIAPASSVMTPTDHDSRQRSHGLDGSSLSSPHDYSQPYTHFWSGPVLAPNPIFNLSHSDFLTGTHDSDSPSPLPATTLYRKFAFSFSSESLSPRDTGLQIMFTLIPSRPSGRLFQTVYPVAWKVLDCELFDTDSVQELECHSEFAVSTGQKDSTSCVAAETDHYGTVSLGERLVYRYTGSSVAKLEDSRVWVCDDRFNLVRKSSPGYPMSGPSNNDLISVTLENSDESKHEQALCLCTLIRDTEGRDDLSPIMHFEAVQFNERIYIDGAFSLQAYYGSNFKQAQQLQESDLIPVTDQDGEPWSVELNKLSSKSWWYIRQDTTGEICIETANEDDFIRDRARQTMPRLETLGNAVVAVDGVVGEIRSEMHEFNAKMSEVEERVAQMSTTTKQVDDDVARMDRTLKKLDEKVDRFESKVHRVDYRMDQMVGKINKQQPSWKLT
ncbi:unnamed protein product [Somion occarium]|uniref:Uncharacterized protein n=1 Tax=Somion occarium TaxID=3059160 RepID=A0ABP1CMY3_9APHY